VTWLTTPPRTFLTGGSGFVGRAVLARADRPVRALVHRTPLGNHVDTVHGDLLDASLPWSTWLDGMEHLVHVARPSAGSARQRTRVAKRTAGANEAMLTAAEQHGITAVAVHGSLSYGDRGEDVVTPDTPVNPIGYARSYAIGEAPWRARTDSICTVVRAPWMLARGSWFSMLYEGDTVPCFGDGSMWMSIADVPGVATWLWSLLDQGPMGVVHPPLLVRCRQRTFAERVAEIREVPVEPWSASRTRRAYGRQTAASIFASLRLDDGQGSASESAEGHGRLGAALQSILGRS